MKLALSLCFTLLSLFFLPLRAQTDSLRQSLLLNERGKQFMDEGDFAEACQSYREALKLYPSRSDNTGRIVLLHNLADALVSLGHISEALHVTDQAGEIPANGILGLELLNLRGNLLTASGRQKEAMDLWKSFPRSVRTSPLFPVYAINAGGTALDSNDPYWGKSILTDAIDAADNARDSLSIYRLLARAMFDTQNHPGMEKMLRKAHFIADRVYSPGDYDYLLLLKEEAGILERQREYRLAAEKYENVAEGFLRLIGATHPAYASAVYGKARCLLGNGENDKAVACYLKYVDSKRKYLKEEITKLQADDLRAFWINNREGVVDAPLFALVSDDNSLGKIFDVVLLSKSFSFDCLREVSVDPSWKRTASTLPRNSVAVEFADYTDLDGKSNTCAFVYRKGDKFPRVVSLPGLRNYYFDKYDKTCKSCQALYQAVWAPLLLEESDEVFFSPSSSLSGIPLEYAMDNNGTLFAEQHRRVIRMITTRDCNGREGKEKYSEAVIWGEMKYKSENDRGAYVAWKDLSWSAYELDGIKDEVRSLPLTLYRGDDATEASFRNHVFTPGGRAIMYVSTHGMYMSPAEAAAKVYYKKAYNMRSLEDNPLLRSFIVFSGARLAWDSNEILDSKEDNTLTAQEISEMDLKGVSLAILAACETGRADSDPELFGFPRAFKLAGVKECIVSLWSVDDAATAKMMILLMKYIGDGDSAEEALIKAVQSIKKTPEYSAPEFWAPFVIIH